MIALSLCCAVASTTKIAPVFARTSCTRPLGLPTCCVRLPNRHHSMNTFLQLPAERRRLAFRQVDEALGLQASSVEKDVQEEIFACPTSDSSKTRNARI